MKTGAPFTKYTYFESYYAIRGSARQNLMGRLYLVSVNFSSFFLACLSTLYKSSAQYSKEENLADTIAR